MMPLVGASTASVHLVDPRLTADIGDQCVLLAMLQAEGLHELLSFPVFPLLSQPGKTDGKLLLQTVQLPEI